jgi:alpha-L-fucosidase 2
VQGLLQNCTADNLMDFHPPQLFQIDGNLGGAAGMAEMLVQSHLGTPDSRIIELLPALPKAWHTGRVKGIKARGNITLDMAWKDGKLTEVTLRSPVAATVRIKNPNGEGVTAYALGADTPLTLNFA